MNEEFINLKEYLAILIELTPEEWFKLIILLVLIILVIFLGTHKTQITGKLLGFLLLIYLILFPLIFTQFAIPLNPTLSKVFYTISFGLILIISYFFTSKTWLFKGITETIKILTWPQSEAWALVFGIIIAIIGPLLIIF